MRYHSNDLHPEGRIIVEKEEYDAFSDDGFIHKGTKVKVVAIDNFSLGFVPNDFVS